jgi:hypothetical protein
MVNVNALCCCLSVPSKLFPTIWKFIPSITTEASLRNGKREPGGTFRRLTTNLAGAYTSLLWCASKPNRVQLPDCVYAHSPHLICPMKYQVPRHSRCDEKITNPAYCGPSRFPGFLCSTTCFPEAPRCSRGLSSLLTDICCSAD